MNNKIFGEYTELKNKQRNKKQQEENTSTTPEQLLAHNQLGTGQMFVACPPM